MTTETTQLPRYFWYIAFALFLLVCTAAGSIGSCLWLKLIANHMGIY